jgi:hypothetical protein
MDPNPLVRDTDPRILNLDPYQIMPRIRNTVNSNTPDYSFI